MLREPVCTPVLNAREILSIGGFAVNHISIDSRIASLQPMYVCETLFVAAQETHPC